MPGKIVMPPKPIRYPPPKAIGGKIQKGIILGRVMHIEHHGVLGDYCRVLDLVRWYNENEEIRNEELRFTYYFRKPNGKDTDWVFGQGAGHMNLETLAILIECAKKSPDFGTFGSVLDNIKVEGIA